MSQSFELTPKQQVAGKLLAGPARHIMFVGGSRSTKTFTFVRAIMIRAVRAKRSRHAILRLRANAARSSIALDTLPKVKELCYPRLKLTEHRQDGFFELPNKSQIWIGGLDDKERVEKILGNEYSTIFYNECSQIPYASVVTSRTRLAQVSGVPQRAYYDLNPVGKGHWTSQEFILHQDPVTHKQLPEPKKYAHLFMNPRDNPYLTRDYLAELDSLPERARRRFYLGEYTDEIEGAFWTYEGIDADRVEKSEVPELRRIVVIVDPSGAEGREDLAADEIGIVAVGLGVDGDAYVLEDRSLRAAPAVWGRAAVKLYHDYAADRIVGEKNFGGEMVRFVIKTADPRVSVKLITASRGKTVRAEPVSALYAQHRVHHVGRLPALEDQLCAMSTAGYEGEGSPDRADAAIWGVTELLLATDGGANLIEAYRRDATRRKRQDGLVPADEPVAAAPASPAIATTPPAVVGPASPDAAAPAAETKIEPPSAPAADLRPVASFAEAVQLQGKDGAPDPARLVPPPSVFRDGHNLVIRYGTGGRRR